MMFFKKKSYTHEFLLIGAPSQEHKRRTMLAWHAPDKSFVEITTEPSLEIPEPTLLGELNVSAELKLQELANTLAAEDAEIKTTGRKLFEKLKEKTENVEGESHPVYLAVVTTKRDRLMDHPMEPSSRAAKSGYLWFQLR
ncbi:hypothetical protein C8J56DRAFT_1020108 [Mycena floridula]|nr:hypothetical protein C8J56DRAFT_1020108 [Mycena floridula]